MATSVTFNGQTRFLPGGITRINADALNQVGITTGTMAIIGEAEGGEPGSSAGLVTLNDPSRAADIFRSGPLVDAIRTAFQASGDPRVPGGASEVVVYKVNSSTRSSVQLPSETQSVHTDTVASSTTTVVTLTTGGLTADEMIGRWVDINIAALPGTPTYRRLITDNDASTITVSPALPQAPAAADTVNIRATWALVQSRDFGAHTVGITTDVVYDSTDENYQVTITAEGVTQSSPDLGGQNRLQLVYTGGANAVAQDTVTTPSTTTATSIALTTGGLVASAHDNKTVVITNPATGNSEQHRINTNAAATLTLEAPGLSADFLAEVQSATTGTVTVDIKTVTNAQATITGSEGAATAFTTTITGVTGDDLNLTIGSTTTLRQLVDTINLNPSYTAEVVAGINPDTTLAKNFDFGTATAINIQKGVDVNGGLGFKMDAYDVVSWIADSAQYATATRYSETGQDGHGIAGSSINDGNPVSGDYPYTLSGGTRGVSANTDWQTALDVMLTRQADAIVCLIDRDLADEGNGSTATWASVSQQLRDHVIEARGTANVERGGYIGFRGTKTEIIAAANSLNDADVQLTCQNPTLPNASGELTEFGPRMMAVSAASMRLGVPEVGEPLTFKFLRASTVTQDSSWDPADKTDATDMVKAGVLFAESIPGQGVRWVRDLTTYVLDNNLAYSEGSVRDVVRFVAYNLRTTLVNRFTGRKAAPATIASIKDTAAALLELYRQNNIIVDSTDPATGATIRAYHNLKVTSSGDVVKLNVGVFPVPGINFQLNDIYLQLPTQSA